MSIPDFQFDPPTGHNNTEVFPDYPPRDQVRPLMQRLFDQIKTYINTFKTSFNSHLAETMYSVALVIEPWNQMTKTTVALGFRPKLVNIKAVIQDTKYQSDAEITPTADFTKYNVASTNDANITGFQSIRFDYNGIDALIGIITITDLGIEINWTTEGSALTGASGNRRLIITGFTHR